MNLQPKKKREPGTTPLNQDAGQSDRGAGDLHSHIAKRAYELDVRRGCQEGYAVEDWLEAEREIRGRNLELTKSGLAR